MIFQNAQYRKVQNMSIVATTAAGDDNDVGDGCMGSKMEYSLTPSGGASAADVDGSEQRLQNDWVARSLTSIAPR